MEICIITKLTRRPLRTNRYMPCPKFKSPLVAELPTASSIADVWSNLFYWIQSINWFSLVKCSHEWIERLAFVFDQSLPLPYGIGGNYCGYLIDHNNYHHYLIDQQLHGLLLLLFALLIQWLLVSIETLNQVLIIISFNKNTNKKKHQRKIM